ncbi:hypothetical protein AB0A77_25355 [Streptomyces varsoviensis]|uniref:hypothetical protein n=1 Tax=Streptomyces varsoviensis TaxID=67373 RepID=UPI0033CC0E98
MPFVVPESEELMEKSFSVAQYAKLVDIRTFEIHGKVLDVEAAAELQPVNNFDTTLGYGRGTDDSLVYRFSHEFTIKGQGDKDAVRIIVQLRALFDFPSEGRPGGDVDDDALLAFGRTTVQMAVYPYLRASVSDIVARLGCDAVTLDLLML